MAPNFLLRWTIQAVIAGSLGAGLVEAFSRSLDFLLRATAGGGIPPVVAAVGAAVVVGLVVYRLAPGAAGEGIPAYLESVRDARNSMPLRDTLLKFPAAVLTLGCYGSGGAVGPIGRVSAGLAQSITGVLQTWFPRLFQDHHQHHADYHAPTTAAISGMAAAVAAIFGAPVAGAVFAVEVIQTDQLRYHQLFPAALSAATAVFCAELMGWAPPVLVAVAPLVFHPHLIWTAVLVGLASGAVGIGYTGLYRLVATGFRRHRRTNRLPRLMVGMASAALLGTLLSPALFGTAHEFYHAVLQGEISRLTGPLLPPGSNAIVILVVLLLGKIVGNCLTTGTGMSAGFTGPAAVVGMALGATIALAIGAPPTSPIYIAAVAAGFSGMLASTMNTPLAATILVAEVFGGGYSVSAVVAAMIAFQVARYSTIYEIALAERLADEESQLPTDAS